MNLHQLVRGPIGAVNPDLVAQFQRSNGYTAGAAAKRTPKYLPAVPVAIQVQPLSGTQIERLVAQNIQGVLHAVYLYGNAQGVVRPSQRGGDLLTFAYPPGAPASSWLIVQVYETWADWSKVAVCLQS